MVLSGPENQPQGRISSPGGRTLGKAELKGFDPPGICVLVRAGPLRDLAKEQLASRSLPCFAL